MRSKSDLRSAQPRNPIRRAMAQGAAMHPPLSAGAVLRLWRMAEINERYPDRGFAYNRTAYIRELEAAGCLIYRTPSNPRLFHLTFFGRLVLDALKV